MSLVYAEGFDRSPLNSAIALFMGPLGKGLEPRCYNTWGANTPAGGYPNIVRRSAVSGGAGRNWIRGYDSTRVWPSNTTPLFILFGVNGAPSEAMRPNPAMPVMGSGVARVIYQWKVSWDPAWSAVIGGSTWYLGYFGTQEMSKSFGVGYVPPAKGYFQYELVYDIAIKRFRLYEDGVLIRTNDATSGQFRLNLAGMSRYNSSNGTLVPIPCYVTDIMVIYDDGIWPSRPLGETSVRDVLMELAGPAHADAEFVAGKDILTAGLKLGSAETGLKLVGAGTNATYKPAEAQAAITTDPVCAFVVDTSRGVGTVAGDLEVKVQTANGSASLKESPVLHDINVQSVIRIPTKAVTVQAMKDTLRVDLAARAR